MQAEARHSSKLPRVSTARLSFPRLFLVPFVLLSAVAAFLVFRPTTPEREIATLARQLAQPVGKLHRVHSAVWARLPQFARDIGSSLEPADPNSLQLAALEALQTLAPQSDAAVGALISVLDDPVIAPRALAVLRKIGPHAKDSVPKLLDLASQPGSARESIGLGPLQALGTIAPNDERVISLLLSKARQGDYQSWSAFAVMAECAPLYDEATRQKLLALAAEKPDLRYSALRIAVRVRPETASTAALLRDFLRDPDPGRKLVAVELLSERPGQNQRPEFIAEIDGILTALEKGLIEEPAWVPHFAWGLQAVNWAPALRPGSDFLERLSICALGQIGPPAVSAVPTLQRRLSGRSFSMRFDAALALHRIAGEFGHLRKALDEGLSDSHPQIRTAAANHLFQLAPESHETVPLLCRALNDPDKHIRLGAARTLGELGSKADSALPHLELRVSDPSPGVREQVTNAIAKIRNL